MRGPLGKLSLLLTLAISVALCLLACIFYAQKRPPVSPPPRTPSWERYDEIAIYLESISPRIHYHALPPMPHVIHSGSLEKIRFRRGHYIDDQSHPQYELLLMRVGPDKMQDVCKLFFDDRKELIGVGRRQFQSLPPPTWATVYRAQD